jgi:DNA repair exonuclease SbcCD ATPase subunit
LIKFHKVSVKNFTSVGNKPITLQLDKHPAVLIQGKNGSGKSSLLIESLSWVLYGRAFRNINKKQLINSINKKDCLVEVEFSIGAKEYKVRRGMAPDVFEIYENDSLLKMSSGSKDYQEHLERRILRINHKSFYQIVTIGSATFIPFMQLSQGLRREIIEDLLDLQVFSQMNRLLKSRIEENRNAVSDIKYEIDVLEEKITLQKEYIRKLKSKVSADREETLLKIADAESKIVANNKRIADIQSTINSELEKLTDHQKFLKRKTQYIQVEGQLKERSKKLKKDVEFFENHEHCPTCKQDIDQGFRCETVEAKQKKLQEIRKAIDQVAEDVSNLNDKIDEFESIQRKISHYQKDITDVNNDSAALTRYKKELEKEISEETKDETFTELEDTLRQYEEDRVVLGTRREELTKKKNIYDISSILLKDGGIKSKVIKQYIPIINAAINNYLNILDLNVQFELNEEFRETIKSRYREEFSYESFSEGEKARLNLAVTFAWRSIAKMRNSSATNLLILDEVADGGVDSDGIDDLVKILSSLHDTHVFVISHREEMMDKFDAALKFEKVKGFTQVVEE